MNEELSALSPLDGRYSSKVADLKEIFSEYGLIKRRVLVEIEWLKSLAASDAIAEVPAFSKITVEELDIAAVNFSVQDAAQIKALEKSLNHDVKSVEYWLKERFAVLPELVKVAEFFHFGCTSEDVNNLSYSLMLKEATERVMIPALLELRAALTRMAHDCADAAMMSRTHGQPATPTTMGKEMANFAYRLGRQIDQLKAQEFLGKINGAVGNYNACLAAYPEYDWEAHAKGFVEHFGLTFNPYTAQIEPHDFIAELCHKLMRVNVALIGLCRDLWGYISLGYFNQRLDKNEVGSSTMPHKVNPIDFENAEGNLGMANAALGHMAQKLPVTRWQRDLTDSTVLRNLGVAFGYCDLAYKSLMKGLGRISVNEQNMRADLDGSWELLAEPIQTVMRRYGVPKPYEQLKSLTRGHRRMTKEVIAEFISGLNLPDDAKKTLLELTPAAYLGKAAELAKRIE